MSWVISFGISFVITALLGPVIIPLLTRLKCGQSILEVGPSWHGSKKGTPTMGGIIFMIGAIVASLITSMSTKTVMLLVCAFAFGLIGLADDYIKVVKKQNLGLSSKEKFFAQTFFAIAFVLACFHTELIDTTVYIPFVQQPIDFGVWHLPFSVFVIVGVVNAVNLTDGIDGLATSVTAVVALFFGLVAAKLASPEYGIVSAAVFGGLLAFLLYNAHPAKVFMGDTGSLFLGGFVAGAAILLRLEFFLLPCGIIYFAETLSVIIQVAVFKKTQKRVFKMTPIHHHFELSGMSENKIVFWATLITVSMCALSYLVLLMQVGGN